MAKRLYRSKTDSMLGGVCGGLGDYFDVDPNIVRLIFVVLVVTGGIGVPAYLVLWLLVPEGASADNDTTLGERVRDGADEIAEKARTIGHEIRDRTGSSVPATTVFIGMALILVGVGFLLRNLGFHWMNWIARIWVWPSVLIAVGLVLLWRWIRGQSS